MGSAPQPELLGGRMALVSTEVCSSCKRKNSKIGNAIPVVGLNLPWARVCLEVCPSLGLEQSEQCRAGRKIVWGGGGGGGESEHQA